MAMEKASKKVCMLCIIYKKHQEFKKVWLFLTKNPVDFLDKTI